MVGEELASKFDRIERNCSRLELEAPHYGASGIPWGFVVSEPRPPYSRAKQPPQLSVR